LSVLRILEEEAMKKGTEKVIAHLPIECATFLLNEKRHAIEQIEARLKVGIIILPSKHLETPAYDIERIKEKESVDDKPSYLQIKAEDIAIPDFAQQFKPRVEKAAVKEFMHDSPAPIQSKNESTGLIKRFWEKLVGPGVEPVIEATAPVAERVRPPDENRPSRGRNNKRGRNQGQRNQEQRPARGHQDRAPKPEPELNKEVKEVSEVIENKETNPNPNRNRNIRGAGRNVRRNLAPVSNTEESVEIVKNEVVINTEAMINKGAPVVDVPSLPIEVTVATGDQVSTERKSSARRGPNRRRPRNPNYKKIEFEGNANTSDSGDAIVTPITGENRAPQSQSYDRDFAGRVERSESSATVTSEPKQTISVPLPTVKAIQETSE
jgi:ribonuclease E